MYISPCMAHYYLEHFAKMHPTELRHQCRILSESLLAIEEERAEVAALPGRDAAKLRADLEQEATVLRAKLAALETALNAPSAEEGSKE